jgi:hypothetical protein
MRRVQLRLEALEQRDMPSYMVMDVPSQGVYRYDSNEYGNDTGWLTSSHASLLAVDTSGDVVGSFPGLGVYVYNNNSSHHGWSQLSSAQASLVAIGGGGRGLYNVVAMFPGSGVYQIDEGGQWQFLTGAKASFLFIDSGGDVAGEFPGMGVWYHESFGNWKQLTPVDATLLSYSEGWIAGYFPGRGVYRELVNQSGWQGLTSTEPTTLFIDHTGDIVGDWQGQLWLYNDTPPIGSSSHWDYTRAPAATQAGMVTAEVGAYFQGNGIWLYDTATAQWRQVLTFNVDYFAFEQ